MVILLGIDEAGKGPVIGPLVIAGVLVDSTGDKNLATLGVKDSKMLTAKEREDLFDKIKKVAKAYKIVVVQPNEIDDAVNGKDGLNLNWLEARKAAEIINELLPEKVLIDCPSNNKEKFRQYLERLLEQKTEIIAEHKADQKYPSVSAASILAKVTRDAEIAKIQEAISEPIGSGYPSDPVTCEFLKKNHKKHAGIFRKSWMSYCNVMDAKQQKRIDEF